MKTESEIEERFVELMEPRLRDDVRLRSQVRLRCGASRFRGDFVAEAAGRVVLFECDGRDYHDYDADRGRDVLILGLSDVTDVIRFRGCDLVFYGPECVEWAERMAPFVFDAGRRPLDAAGMSLMSHSLLIGQAKPIWRTKAMLDREDAGLLRDHHCCTLLHRYRGECTLEWKDPAWSRACMGRPAWPFAALVGKVASKLFG